MPDLSSCLISPSLSAGLYIPEYLTEIPAIDQDPNVDGFDQNF